MSCRRVISDSGSLRDFPGEFIEEWQGEAPWLSHVKDHMAGTSAGFYENVSHAAYHASRHQSPRKLPAINAILPLHYDKASSPSMLKHGVDLIAAVTKYLNGDQPVVIGVDQSIFAIGKQLQWNFPEQYGCDKVLFMFGPLHIEMDFLRILGAYMEGCGWTSIVVNSGITTAGSAEALLKVRCSFFLHCCHH